MGALHKTASIIAPFEPKNEAIKSADYAEMDAG
jgi:hypothetical protein